MAARIGFELDFFTADATSAAAARCLMDLFFAALWPGPITSKTASGLHILLVDLDSVTKLLCCCVLLASTLATVCCCAAVALCLTLAQRDVGLQMLVVQRVYVYRGSRQTVRDLCGRPE